MWQPKATIWINTMCNFLAISTLPPLPHHCLNLQTTAEYVIVVVTNICKSLKVKFATKCKQQLNSKNVISFQICPYLKFVFLINLSAAVLLLTPSESENLPSLPFVWDAFLHINLKNDWKLYVLKKIM